MPAKCLAQYLAQINGPQMSAATILMLLLIMMMMKIVMMLPSRLSRDTASK